MSLCGVCSLWCLFSKSHTNQIHSPSTLHQFWTSGYEIYTCTCIYTINTSLVNDWFMDKINMEQNGNWRRFIVEWSCALTYIEHQVNLHRSRISCRIWQLDLESTHGEPKSITTKVAMSLNETNVNIQCTNWQRIETSATLIKWLLPLLQNSHQAFAPTTLYYHQLTWQLDTNSLTLQI